MTAPDLSACDCRNSVDDCDFPDCKAGRVTLPVPAPAPAAHGEPVAWIATRLWNDRETWTGLADIAAALATPAPVAQPEHGGDIRKCRDCADFGPTCPWDGKACASSAAPAPVAPILTDAQIEQMWSNAFNDTSGVKMSQVLARAIERACAEAWGVKLVEATGQEGGAA